MWTAEKRKLQSIKLTGRNKRLSQESYDSMVLKMRVAKLGTKKKFTEEHKRNISISRQAMKTRLGYINSPETRFKIGSSNKGKVRSNETKLKMSAVKKGDITKES